MRYFVFVVLSLYSTIAFAQQSLMPAQECENYKQELVLSDITYQELRARSGNIMRQAYELEAKVRALESEKKQLQDDVVKLKEAGESAKPGDATPRDLDER